MAMHYDFDESQPIILSDQRRHELIELGAKGTSSLPLAIIHFCDGDVEKAYHLFLVDMTPSRDLFGRPGDDNYVESLERFRKFMRRKVWFWVN